MKITWVNRSVESSKNVKVKSIQERYWLVAEFFFLVGPAARVLKHLVADFRSFLVLFVNFLTFFMVILKHCEWRQKKADKQKMKIGEILCQVLTVIFVRKNSTVCRQSISLMHSLDVGAHFSGASSNSFSFYGLQFSSLCFPLWLAFFRIAIKPKKVERNVCKLCLISYSFYVILCL